MTDTVKPTTPAVFINASTPGGLAAAGAEYALANGGRVIDVRDTFVYEGEEKTDKISGVRVSVAIVGATLDVKVADYNTGSFLAEFPIGSNVLLSGISGRVYNDRHNTPRLSLSAASVRKA